MIHEIITSCNELPKVSSDAAEAYARASVKLQAHVYEQLEGNPKIKEHIGHNPFDMMRDNHRNHAAFMSTVFNINSFEIMVRTVPWIYRAHRAKGFSYDYFPIEHIAWQIAIHDCLHDSNLKSEVTTSYKWLVQNHEKMIKLSLIEEDLPFSMPQESNELQQKFLSLLLHGDTHECLNLVNKIIVSADDLKHFYLKVIWPVLYQIGHLWESNQISVAEEHLATAIVGRIMAALYPRFSTFDTTKGKVIVSAGPNEFHEVGARMVADFMEMDGWDVTYLGASVPAGDILKILKRDSPVFIALSVATVFNLHGTQQLIQMIRQDQETKGIKVMVGGNAFRNMPNLWQTIGADGYAPDSESALDVSNGWWIKENQKNA